METTAVRYLQTTRTFELQSNVFMAMDLSQGDTGA